jgi:hypothetical protein
MFRNRLGVDRVLDKLCRGFGPSFSHRLAPTDAAGWCRLPETSRPGRTPEQSREAPGQPPWRALACDFVPDGPPLVGIRFRRAGHHVPAHLVEKRTILFHLAWHLDGARLDMPCSLNADPQFNQNQFASVKEAKPRRRHNDAASSRVTRHGAGRSRNRFAAR